MKLTSLLLAVLAIAATTPSSWAQRFEDDIYFDASKAKKKTTPAQPERPTAPASFLAADQFANELTPSARNISVDEYNRRGMFAVADTISVDSLAANGLSGDAFANTRRIERFYNPNVVIENPDGTVADYYYGDAPAEINIYINNSYPSYYDPWRYSPWYVGSPFWGLSSWGLSSYYYNPWYYGGYYNPWVWGWEPLWAGGLIPCWGWTPSWGPNWAWGWAWAPDWGPAWGPIGGGPGGSNRPSTTRPQPSHGSYGGSYRHAANASGSSGTRNPGASSGSNWNINNVGHRPGTGTSSAYRPGASGSNRGGSNNNYNATGRRPGSILNSNRNNSGRQNQSNYTNRTNTNRNTNNYNNRSEGFQRSSSSSVNNSSSFQSSGSGSGSMGGGSMGGGSFRSGAGGGGGSVGGGSRSGGGGGRRH